MFCRNCGTELCDDARFCHKCACPVAEEKAPEKRSGPIFASSKTSLHPAVVAVIWLLAALAVFFVFKSNEDKYGDKYAFCGSDIRSEYVSGADISNH